MKPRLVLMFVLGVTTGLLFARLMDVPSSAAAVPIKEFNVVGQVKLLTTDPTTFTILLSGSDASGTAFKP